MKEPALAVFLLQRFGRDETLAGDILEEYEHRQSRTWLWRQVAVAVLLAVPYGVAGRSRSGARMRMPVGGIGLIAIAFLVTTVAPGAWWFIVAGAVGGVLLAAVLIAAGRRRATPSERAGNILLR